MSICPRHEKIAKWESTNEKEAHVHSDIGQVGTGTGMKVLCALLVCVWNLVRAPTRARLTRLEQTNDALDEFAYVQADGTVLIESNHKLIRVSQCG